VIRPNALHVHQAQLAMEIIVAQAVNIIMLMLILVLIVQHWTLFVLLVAVQVNVIRVQLARALQVPSVPATAISTLIQLAKPVQLSTLLVPVVVMPTHALHAPDPRLPSGSIAVMQISITILPHHLAKLVQQ